MADDGIRRRTPIPPEFAQAADIDSDDELQAAREAAVEDLQSAPSGTVDAENIETLGMEVVAPAESGEVESEPRAGSASGESSEPTESTALLLLTERLAELIQHIRNNAYGYCIAAVVALIALFAVVVIALVMGAPTTVVELSPPMPAWVSWRQRTGDDGTPRILLWNHTAGPAQRRTYNPAVCSTKSKRTIRCTVTEDRQRIMDSDAIVFEADRLGSMWVPSKRADYQLWVFWAKSPPPPMGNTASGSSYLSLPLIATKFNLTMGYRYDADVVVPYKAWHCTLPTDKPLPAPSNSLGSLQTPPKTKKDAAWILGDCERNRFERAIRSSRENGDNRSRIITADSNADTVRLQLLSSCGEHQCSSLADCIRYVAENYHFIVVSLVPECFETAYEVIYAAFEYDLVPVVLEPPNTKLEVPNESIVSSAQQQGPGQLAAHLRGLLDNREAYEAHFAWKRHCAVVEAENELCPLCRLLWEDSDRRRLHPDVQEWWTQRSRCRDEPLFGLDSAFVPEV